MHLPTKSFDGVIVACDSHYHLAAIKIHTNTRLSPATLACLHDSFPIDTSQIRSLVDRNAFGHRPHSNSFNIFPGDSVISVGHYFTKPYEVMAAPGVFRLDFYHANSCM